MRVRLNRIDSLLVMEMAASVGMKRAEFIRWCTVEVARAMQSQQIK